MLQDSVRVKMKLSKRSEAYIGVLIDDNILLRGQKNLIECLPLELSIELYLEDNADIRLTELGRTVGLVSDEDYALYQGRISELKNATDFVKETSIAAYNLDSEMLDSKDNSGTKLEAIIKKPKINIDQLVPYVSEIAKLSKPVRRRLEIELKYSGYIDRKKIN